MKTSNLNVSSKMNQVALLDERTGDFKSKRAGVIAWAIFFGVGVSYFVATMIIAIR